MAVDNESAVDLNEQTMTAEREREREKGEGMTRKVTNEQKLLQQGVDKDMFPCQSPI